MSINTLYRVRVDIPEEVWVKVFDSWDYFQKVVVATEGNLTAESYDTFESATFDTLPAAQACEAKLKAVIAEYQK